MNKIELDAQVKTTAPLGKMPRIFGVSHWAIIGVVLAGTAIFLVLQ